MIVKGEGIVLRCVSFSNTSQITTLYTPDSGKMAIMAKGIRKGKPSRQFPGVMEPMQHIHYVIYQKSSSALAILNEYELKNSYPRIRLSLKRIFTALYLVEFINETTLENDSCPQLFSLLRDSLEELARGEPAPRVRFFFQFKALKILGHAPRVDICVRCRRVLENTVSFAAKKNAFFCMACKNYVNDRSVQLRRESLEYLQRVAGSVDGNRDEHFSEAMVRELDTFFRFYLYLALTKELKTARYFKSHF